MRERFGQIRQATQFGVSTSKKAWTRIGGLNLLFLGLVSTYALFYWKLSRADQKWYNNTFFQKYHNTKTIYEPYNFKFK